MASSCGLCAHPGTFFVKILEQMSMVTLYFLGTTAEGFVLSHASLKHLNILSSQLGKNKSESQGLTPSSRGHACEMRRGGWGCAFILSVMPHAAPDIKAHMGDKETTQLCALLSEQTE